VPAEKNIALSQLAGIDDLPETSMEAIQQWKILLGLLVTKELTPRKSVTIDVGFPKEQKEIKARMTALLDWCRERPQINELIANVMHLPEAEIDHSQQAVLNALGYLLPLLAAQLDVIFQQQGQCDYPAITLAALNALEPAAEDGAISDITLRLDYQLRHILVDEFQDTSAAQIKLLEQLIAGWQPGDGRTLFLVGDAMQSLYGFRNANVGLFLNAQRHPVGPVQCAPLALSSNFRSQQGIIDWVNQAFSQAFPAAADISRGAIPYSPSTAIKTASEGQAVSFQGFSGDDEEAAEADYIANLCGELVSQHPDESIAILVRGRGHLRAIVPALREANLLWQAIDITKLASRMPVMDLLSITRALLSPADRIAWLAVLRAPFCGFNMTDLLAVSNHQQSGGSLLEQLINLAKNPELAPLSAEGRAILLRVAPLLADAWQNRGRVNLRNAVEQLWVELGGPATLMGSEAPASAIGPAFSSRLINFMPPLRPITACRRQTVTNRLSRL
jgi:ATP-dependent helicase/nuclease subunit A